MGRELITEARLIEHLRTKEEGRVPAGKQNICRYLANQMGLRSHRAWRDILYIARKPALPELCVVWRSKRSIQSMGIHDPDNCEFHPKTKGKE